MRSLPLPAINALALPERDTYQAAGNRNTIGRTLATPKRVGAFVILGQSNGTNCVSTPYAVANVGRVLNFNVYDGGLYEAKEPLLGCGVDSGGHTFGGDFGDRQINASRWRDVDLLPIAIGATEMLDWTPTSGQGRATWMWPRVVAVMERYAALGRGPISAWLWMIGEQDAGNPVSGTTQQQFIDRHDEFRLGIRALGSNAPIFMPVETHPYQGTAQGIGIAAAQAALVNHDHGVWAGPNVDAITGATYRPDGIHIGSAAGRSVLSAEWNSKVDLAIAAGAL